MTPVLVIPQELAGEVQGLPALGAVIGVGAGTGEIITWPSVGAVGATGAQLGKVALEL